MRSPRPPSARRRARASFRLDIDATVAEVRFALRGPGLSPGVAWTSESGVAAGRGVMTPIAPDAFEWVWQPPSAGRFAFAVPGGPRWSVEVPYSPEWRRLGADEEVLDRLAAKTGGRRVRQWRELAPVEGERPPGRVRGRPVFLLAALLCLVQTEAALTFRAR